jgi:hypothetical protein
MFLVSLFLAGFAPDVSNPSVVVHALSVNAAHPI